jgi:hypothetical protein
LYEILSLEWDWEAVIVLHFDIFLGCQGDELEEGEIAASVDSDQRSESWIDGREEAEEIAEDEEDYTVQPQKKRKRSRSHRRIAQLEGLGERETSNGSLLRREASMFQKLKHQHGLALYSSTAGQMGCRSL